MSRKGAGKKKEEAQVRQMAELVVQVRSGLLSASEAAKRLGVSRKTYYKRENRALSGLVEGLSERQAGRPAKEVDKEKEELKRKIRDLEAEVKVLRQTMQIRAILDAPQNPAESKHRKRKRKSDNGGVSGQGLSPERESSANLEGRFPGDEARNGKNDAEGEYGLEKKSTGRE
jgi:transposase